MAMAGQSQPTLGGWLLHVLREADGALSLEEALHAIMDSVKTYFPVQSIAVILADLDTKELRIKTGRQISYSFAKTFRRAAPGPHVERLLLEQQPILVNHASRDSDLYKEIKLEHDFDSAALAPIIRNHRAVGYLMCDRADMTPFDEADLLHLQVLGLLIGSLMAKFDLLKERRQLSQTDDATGTLKYSVFIAAMTTEILRSRTHDYPLALALMDVAAFRVYVDTYGIDRAHELLAECASLIKRHLRETDALARYAADQFILYLSGVTEEEARRIIEQAQHDIRRQAGAGASIPIEANAGVLFLRTDAAKKRPIQDLLGALGKALVHARSAGPGGLQMVTLN